jgi:hypothetical protein
MNQVPLWIVASLGKSVQLVDLFKTSLKVYPAGSVGVLTSIQSGGGLYVTVALDEEDETYLENFSFDQVQPIHDQVKFQLDLENGAIAF